MAEQMQRVTLTIDGVKGTFGGPVQFDVEQVKHAKEVHIHVHKPEDMSDSNDDANGDKKEDTPKQSKPKAKE